MLDVPEPVDATQHESKVKTQSERSQPNADDLPLGTSITRWCKHNPPTLDVGVELGGGILFKFRNVLNAEHIAVA